MNINEDLKVTGNTYHCYETKDLTEVDATFAISVDDIIKILKRHESSSIV